MLAARQPCLKYTFGGALQPVPASFSFLRGEVVSNDERNTAVSGILVLRYFGDVILLSGIFDARISKLDL